MIYGGKQSAGGGGGSAASVLQGIGGKLAANLDPNLYGDGTILIGGNDSNYAQLVSAGEMHFYAFVGDDGDGQWLEILGATENGTLIYSNPNNPFANLVLNSAGDLVLYAGGGTKNPRSSFGYLTTLVPDNLSDITPTAAGVEGNIQVTGDYVYICIGPDTWVRSPITRSW